jgi:uncharacterized protein YjlB
MSDSTLAPHPSPEIIARTFMPGGGVPNNAKLPLVIYRQALPAGRPNLASEIEGLYHDHGWGGTWRWSVYDFHHFHSNAHESLAVFRGTARVQFGGESGEAFDVGVGDVIIIPAGVGHKKLKSSDDFQVVGGYPGGQVPDMNRDDETTRAGVQTAIINVALPAADPIYGAAGPLMRLWKV